MYKDGRGKRQVETQDDSDEPSSSSSEQEEEESVCESHRGCGEGRDDEKDEVWVRMGSVRVCACEEGV